MANTCSALLRCVLTAAPQFNPACRVDRIAMPAVAFAIRQSPDPAAAGADWPVDCPTPAGERPAEGVSLPLRAEPVFADLGT